MADPQPSPQPLPSHVSIAVPPEIEAGVYADFASIWHTRESFVLDFVATTGPTRQVADDQGRPRAQTPSKVVSRVRIPASQVFEIMKGLERQLTAWEAETGRRAGGPPAPPVPPPAS
ncbi:MAG TPA: DUF3467 domain-containing protein [Jiangellales bacterium]|nr:DUF3467 domain-containing protein [Jiangellales bacterium]